MLTTYQKPRTVLVVESGEEPAFMWLNVSKMVTDIRQDDNTIVNLFGYLQKAKRNPTTAESLAIAVLSGDSVAALALADAVHDNHLSNYLTSTAKAISE